MTACASNRPATVPVDQEGVPSARALRMEIAEVEQELRLVTSAWEGTPYQWGGVDRQGVDCSAFVQLLYREALGIDLPRTTEYQQAVGHAVRMEEMQSGDLIFFYTPQKTRHVGVYLRNGEFAHASTSQGVTISSLSSRYWQDAYRTTRRVLPAKGEPVSQTPASIPRKRVGW